MPTALLTPPSHTITTDQPNRVVLDPVARRLAALVADSQVTLDIPTTGASHAATLAAHSPDLFLVSSPVDRRASLVAGVVSLAAKAGQRVLVLSNEPDAMFAALAAGGQDIGRAIGAHENAEGSKHASHTAFVRGQRYREALRVGLSDRVSELQARINTEERREKLLAEVDVCTGDLATVGEWAAGEVDASDAMKEAVATRDAGIQAVAAHEASRADAESELNALKQAAAQPAGFLKKLFSGGSKPDPAKVEAAEVRVQELSAATPPDPIAIFSATRERLLAEAATARRTERESVLAAVRHELAAMPLAEPLDELCRAFDDATSDLARLEASPPNLPTAELDAVRVVVGSPAAIGADPFVTLTHPEVGPRFDRIIWADAEELTDEAFAVAAPLGSAWVLVGMHDPANGRSQSPFFSGWWHRLHTAFWTQEAGRPLARLLTVENRGELQREPLHDRPEVEVRWADRDGAPTLAEVLFPLGMTLSAAKALLAQEADETRFAGYGPTEWLTTDDSIRCRWPAVDAAVGEREEVELGNGVREEVVAGVTAAVHFNASVWSRDTAARWLSERLVPIPRVAIV